MYPILIRLAERGLLDTMGRAIHRPAGHPVTCTDCRRQASPPPVTCPDPLPRGFAPSSDRRAHERGPNLAVVSATLVLLALSWVAAALLLRRCWRSPSVPGPVDAPARLLRVASAAQPPHRRDWGAAMSAELGGIDDRGDRWRFALGCTWALTRSAVGMGASAALLLGVGFLLDSRLRLGSDGVADYLFLACVAIGFAVGALATLTYHHAFPAGVLAGMATALLGSLIVASLWIPEAMHWYADGGLLLDGEGGPLVRNRYPFAVNLWDGATTVAVLPLWILPFAVFGAAAASALRRPSRT